MRILDGTGNAGDLRLRVKLEDCPPETLIRRPPGKRTYRAMTRNFPFTPLYPSTTYLAPTGNSRGSPDSKRLFDKAMMSLREAIREQNVSSEAHVPWNM